MSFSSTVSNNREWTSDTVWACLPIPRLSSTNSPPDIPHGSTFIPAYIPTTIPMSLPPLDSQFSSIPGSSPSYNLSAQKPHPPKPVISTSWTAPFRDGLPTPPGDMTGLTYNAMPHVPYGGNALALSSHLYAPQRNQYDSISSSMSAAIKPTHHAPANDMPATDPVPKKSTSSSSGSQLRIPTSINASKGNLAEFAAQVGEVRLNQVGAPKY